MGPGTLGPRRSVLGRAPRNAPSVGPDGHGLREVCSLRTHERTYLSGDDVLVNPDVFAWVKIGSVIAITQHEKPAEARGAQQRRVAIVKVQSVDVLKGAPKTTEISIFRNIAELYNFSNYSTVSVSRAREEDHVIQSLELIVKDQYVSSSEMWRLKLQMLNSSIFESKEISIGRIAAVVKDIRLNNGPATSGIVTNDTKCTFRSRSASIIMMIQVSREMWDFNQDGRIYFEITMSFLKELLNRWAQADVTHRLTVILFGRGSKPKSEHCDFYETIVDSVLLDDLAGVERSLLRSIQLSFYGFPKKVLRKDAVWGEATSNDLRSALSTSVQSNFLEAVNLGLNLLDTATHNQSLHTTGKNIVVITPGSGVHRVATKLAHITKRRMMDSGIGCDEISVRQPPGHATPFFMYDNELDLRQSAIDPTWASDPSLSRIDSVNDAILTVKSGSPVTGACKSQLGRIGVPNHWLHVRFLGKLPNAIETIKTAGVIVPTFYGRDDELARLKTPSSQDEMERFDAMTIQGDDERATSTGHNSSASSRNGSPSNSPVQIINADGNCPNPLSAFRALHRKTESVGGAHKLSNLAQAVRRSRSTMMLVNQKESATSVSPIFENNVSDRIAMNLGDREQFSDQQSDWNSFVQGSHLSKSDQRHRLSLSSDRRRWAHAVPGWDPSGIGSSAIVPFDFEGSEMASEMQYLNRWMWKSLVEPAILPLTTDYSPERKGCNRYNHTVTLPSSGDGLRSENVRLILQELICQRMTLDYQVVVGLSDDLFVKNVASKELYEKALLKAQKSSSSGRFKVNLHQTKCCLARGKEVHELVLDSLSESVDVRRYVQRESQNLDYRWKTHLKCWNLSLGFFEEREQIFSAMSQSLNWSNLDQLLVDCAPTREFVSDALSLPLRRIQLCLMPVGSLQSVATVSENFNSFWVAVQKLYPECFDGPVRRISNNQFYGRTRRLDEALASQSLQKKWESGYISLPSRPEAKRKEWAIISRQMYWSPGHAFRFTMGWLVAESTSIDEFVQQMQRKAKQLGFACSGFPSVFEGVGSSVLSSRCNYSLSFVQILFLVEELQRAGFGFTSCGPHSFGLLSSDAKELVHVDLAGRHIVQGLGANASVSWATGKSEILGKHSAPRQQGNLMSKLAGLAGPATAACTVLQTLFEHGLSGN